MKVTTEFVCKRCGACCRAQGYVRLQPGEAEAIARALEMDAADFYERYTRLTSDRRGLSLTEAAGGACVFLQPDGLCRIHAAKPRQCSGYPARWRSEILDDACAAIGCNRNACPTLNPRVRPLAKC